MQVEVIKYDKESAYFKYLKYSEMEISQKTDADWELENFFRKIAEGSRILDIEKVFKLAGLHENGLPKLAIATADKSYSYFHYWQTNQCSFSGSPTWRSGSCANVVLKDVFDFSGFELKQSWFGGTQYRTSVPHIPPDIRPKKSYLKDYHILFEVEDWQIYNRDPLLLKRINRRFFEVVAEWELSELEAMILSDLVNAT